MMGLLYMHVTVCGTKARGFQKSLLLGYYPQLHSIR